MPIHSYNYLYALVLPVAKHGQTLFYKATGDVWKFWCVGTGLNFLQKVLVFSDGKQSFEPYLIV